MKILSFYTHDSEQDMSTDLTIFFEMTDMHYERMIRIPFNDINEMYDHCKSVCDGEWNSSLYEDERQYTEITLSFAYEHTTKSTFTFN